jgi:cell division FtsZ-interacting protein ZapD
VTFTTPVMHIWAHLGTNNDSALVSVRLESAIHNHEMYSNFKAQYELRSALNMALDSIRITPEELSTSGVTKLSLVMLCCVFRSALHFVGYFHSDISEEDLMRLKSNLLLLKERWAIGGKS